MTEVQIPIDAYLVRLNRTHQFGIHDEDKPFIKAIHSIFLFDKNRITHCCEITPSYEMIFVYDEVEFVDGVSDSVQNKLDEKYGYCGGDNCYIHCHEIDQIIADNKPFTVHHYGDTQVSFDDVEYDVQMESLVEHFNCNHAL